MDLVIMAAGLGSRFGGLKQLQPVDDDKNFIIDYSIFDAIKVGFERVIFIIKENLLEDFKLTIGNRISQFIEIEYVFQDNKNIPKLFDVPVDRTKPFGTGHAILCAKDKIKSDFIVINADDFYGRDAFYVAYNFLINNKSKNTYALIGYKAINTIGNNGAVKRGICTCQNNKLNSIIECSIEKQDDSTLIATPLNSSLKQSKLIADDQIVSMNLFAFTKDFLNYLPDAFLTFLESNKNNLTDCEFFLPEIVSDLIKTNKVSVDILQTDSKWLGITYKSDLDDVKNEILKLKNSNIYPEKLWNQ